MTTTDISALTALNDDYEPLYAWAASLPKHRCPKAPAWCDVCQRYVKRKRKAGESLQGATGSTGPVNTAYQPPPGGAIEVHELGSAPRMLLGCGSVPTQPVAASFATVGMNRPRRTDALSLSIGELEQAMADQKAAIAELGQLIGNGVMSVNQARKHADAAPENVIRHSATLRDVYLGGGHAVRQTLDASGRVVQEGLWNVWKEQPPPFPPVPLRSDLEMHVIGPNRVAVHCDGDHVIVSVDEANKLKNDYAMGKSPEAEARHEKIHYEHGSRMRMTKPELTYIVRISVWEATPKVRGYCEDRLQRICDLSFHDALVEDANDLDGGV